jgi:hypothetical protein
MRILSDPVGAREDPQVSYDPEKCNWPSWNLDPAFNVPGSGKYTIVRDMSFCGGLVQNFEIALMAADRSRCHARLQVLDQTGHVVGAYAPNGSLCVLGTVPDGTIYTVVVFSGTHRDEECILNYAGGI